MHGTTLTDPAVFAVPFPVPARAANVLVLPITATSMRAEGVEGVDGRGCLSAEMLGHPGTGRASSVREKGRQPQR